MQDMEGLRKHTIVALWEVLEPAFLKLDPYYTSRTITITRTTSIAT